MKGSKKDGVASNYRPLTCLSILRKLLTGVIGDEIYGHLETSTFLQNKQKVCCRESIATKDELLIDKTISRNCRKVKRNVAIRFIDYKKAYIVVSHSWLKEKIKIMGVADNVSQLLGHKLALFGKQ